MDFCSPSYFPVNDCCFACVPFHIPVLPFPPALPLFLLLVLSRASPSKILLSMPAPGPSSCVLPLTWFTFILPFLPCTSFPSCIFLFLTSLRFRTFHVCPALPLPKSCWACPLQIPPPAYFFPFPFILHFCTFLYCGFYLFCVCILFIFFFFYWDFSKNLFEI